MKKRLVSLLLVLMLVMSIIVGCGGQDGEEVEEVSKSDGEQILFNGSSTLAPVISSIAEGFNDEFGNWSAVDGDLPDEDIAIYVSAGGSGQGAKALIDKTTSFGMLAREAKEEEIEAIEDYKEYKVGIDALTLAVSADNPINGVMDDLTKEEIVKVFSGEYETWADLNPELPAEEIIVITRDVGGGAHSVFQKNIMGDVDVKDDAIQAASMGELVQNVIDNPNAIGYGSFGVVNQNIDKVATLKVDGVEATAENIVDGSYIIQRPLLVIGSGDPTAKQQAFLDVVLGETGQAMVEEMGFIPMN